MVTMATRVLAKVSVETERICIELVILRGTFVIS